MLFYPIIFALISYCLAFDFARQYIRQKLEGEAVSGQWSGFRAYAFPGTKKPPKAVISLQLPDGAQATMTLKDSSFIETLYNKANGSLKSAYISRFDPEFFTTECSKTVTFFGTVLSLAFGNCMMAIGAFKYQLPPVLYAYEAIFLLVICAYYQLKRWRMPHVAWSTYRAKLDSREEWLSKEIGPHEKGEFNFDRVVNTLRSESASPTREASPIEASNIRLQRASSAALIILVVFGAFLLFVTYDMRHVYEPHVKTEAEVIDTYMSGLGKTRKNLLTLQYRPDPSSFITARFRLEGGLFSPYLYAAIGDKIDVIYNPEGFNPPIVDKKGIDIALQALGLICWLLVLYRYVSLLRRNQP